jgi:hypothetical protein
MSRCFWQYSKLHNIFFGILILVTALSHFWFFPAVWLINSWLIAINFAFLCVLRYFLLYVSLIFNDRTFNTMGTECNSTLYWVYLAFLMLILSAFRILWHFFKFLSFFYVNLLRLIIREIFSSKDIIFSLKYLFIRSQLFS